MSTPTPSARRRPMVAAAACAFVAATVLGISMPTLQGINPPRHAEKAYQVGMAKLLTPEQIAANRIDH